MNITLAQFSQMISTNANPLGWYQPSMDLFQKYNINTKNRIAGFMAQCGHESSDFNVTLENLNYSWQRLRQVFPSHFATDADAQKVDRKPQAIANIVYANRLGNGNVSSGDGWKFRGHGLIQLTGRSNITKFGASIGMNADQAVAYCETPKGALESACWFWTVNNLNHFCDADDIIGLTHAVNGGSNGLAERTARYNKAKTIIG